MAVLSNPDPRTRIIAVACISASLYIVPALYIFVPIVVSLVPLLFLRKRFLHLFLLLLPVIFFCVVLAVVKSFSDTNSFYFSASQLNDSFVLSLRIIAAAQLSFVMILSTPTLQLSSAICALLKPVPFMRLLGIDLIISLALIQFPFLIRIGLEKMKAARSRSAGRFFKPSLLKALSLSLTISAIQRSSELSKALEARNFTGDFVFKTERLSAHNILIILISILLLLGALLTKYLL